MDTHAGLWLELKSEKIYKKKVKVILFVPDNYFRVLALLPEFPKLDLDDIEGAGFRIRDLKEKI